MKWFRILFAILLSGFLVYLFFDLRANPDLDLNWSVLSLGLALLGLMGFFLRFESTGIAPGEVALLATMSALAALGRIPFAALPNVQPTTFLVIVAGYVLGPGAGFAVGALAALTSNFFLGLGPWTPWQMVGWGLAGLSAGILACYKTNLHRLVLVACAVSWGYLYGIIMNTWHWLSFIYPLTWQTFAATYAAGFAFDTLHAVGNGVFMYLMGMEMIKILRRFSSRLTVKILPVEELRSDENVSTR